MSTPITRAQRSNGPVSRADHLLLPAGLMHALGANNEYKPDTLLYSTGYEARTTLFDRLVISYYSKLSGW